MILNIGDNANDFFIECKLPNLAKIHRLRIIFNHVTKKIVHKFL